MFSFRFLMRLLLLIIFALPVALQAQNNGWEIVDYDSQEHPFRKKKGISYFSSYAVVDVYGGTIWEMNSRGQLKKYFPGGTKVYETGLYFFNEWKACFDSTLAFIKDQSFGYEDGEDLQISAGSSINPNLKGKYFNTLYHTRENVWFTTSDELIRMEKHNKNFVVTDKISGEALKPFFEIVSDDSSYVLLMNGGRIYEFVDGYQEFEYLPLEDSIISYRKIYTDYNNGNYLVTTTLLEGRDAFYTYNSKGLITYNLSNRDQLGRLDEVKQIKEDCYIGTFSKGFVIFEGAEATVTLYSQFEGLEHLYIDDTLFSPAILDNGYCSFQLFESYSNGNTHFFTYKDGIVDFYYSIKFPAYYFGPFLHYRVQNNENYLFYLEYDKSYNAEYLLIIKDLKDTTYINLPGKINWVLPGGIKVDSAYIWLSYNEYGRDKRVWRLKREKSFIRGKVFYDSNQNGVQDADEYSVNKYPVVINPGELKIFPSRSGSFAFHAQPGADYTLEIPADSLFNYTSQTLPLALDYDIENQIGITLANPDYHIATNFNLPWPRCNTSSSAWLKLENTGFLSIQDVRVKLVVDQPVYLAPVDGAVVDDTLVFEVSDLKPRENLELWYNIQWPGASLTGQSVSFRLFAEIHDNEQLYQQFKDSIATVIRCSYDPNDKSVTPVGVGDRNYTLMDSPFTYLIRFENTGNDTAYHVTIYDTLDVNLNKNTFKLLGASHDVVTSIDKYGIATFYFENIMLPDSTTDKEKAQGFVRFYIEPVSGLAEETEITNKAGIVFDSNEPIITNQVVNTMVTTLPAITAVSHRQKQTGIAYPNLASDKIYFRGDCRRTEIYNAAGILISSSDSKTIQSSDWPEGLYLIKCYNEYNEPTVTDRIVIQR